MLYCKCKIIKAYTKKKNWLCFQSKKATAFLRTRRKRKMKKTLYLIKMGNDFNKNDEIIKNSDLNNYRYFIHNITLKNNKNLDTLEISSGARYKYKNNKIYRNDCFGC